MTNLTYLLHDNPAHEVLCYLVGILAGFIFGVATGRGVSK